MDLIALSHDILWAALAVCLLGCAWRLYGIFRMPEKTDLSVPRQAAGLRVARALHQPGPGREGAAQPSPER